MAHMTEVARTIHDLSLQRWGPTAPVQVIGRHDGIVDMLNRLVRFARSDSSVLVTGETGTGKELVARALYLLSDRNRKPFAKMNCAQYQEGQIIASELFGHRKGSFTGAVADHEGIFQSADGGVVFLDEIGELSLQVQAMLLRVLSEGEVVAVGGTQARRVDVRVVAATNQDLRARVQTGAFRADLYYRLRYLHIEVPPLRLRGDDWELILAHHVARLAEKRATVKRFSDEALTLLRHYDWPGNVREVKALADTGFCLSDDALIEPRHFIEALESAARVQQFQNVPLGDVVTRKYEALVKQEGSFWDLVYQPYMDRDLTRADVQAIVARGLTSVRGSYKRLLARFGVAPGDYLRFMDFLRHHRLKPDG
jgi:transcriptional regulator with GAF, ATPase, and Fis domain